jgi:hypothetical protein
LTSVRKEILPPNGTSGEHRWRGVTLADRTIEIGRSDVYDSIFDCHLINCVIRTFRGARGVSFPDCTLESCTIEAKKELRNLRFTRLTMRDCTLFGRYVGCRFGGEDADEKAEVTRCDFSKAILFDKCDFLYGVDVQTLTLPTWPHITITNIAKNRKRLLELPLPESLRILKGAVAYEDSIANAVSFHLPAHYAQYEDLRPIFDAEDYIR